MNGKVKKLAAAAMLTAAALIIFIIEAQIPPIVPIPGIKLGLSNVVTLTAILMLGKAWGSGVHIVRIFLGTLFTGQAVSFLYSISGGRKQFYNSAGHRAYYRVSACLCSSG